MKQHMILNDFIKYASLNVLGMIGLSCYILADTFFISKGLGAEGLTALNLAIPVYSFIHGSGLMIGMGGGTRYSILKSQNRQKDMNQVFTNAAVAFLLPALFFCAGLFFSAPLTHLLGANETVFEMTQTYLRVILFFAPAFMLNNLLLCFVRNDGAPQLSMLAMLMGSFSNILLDYIFIFPCKMGIFGAVLATGFAPLISILILSTFFFQKKNHFHLEKCRISSGLIRHICSDGLPSLITELSSGIVIIIFNMIILNLQGNTGVAAYGIIANISLVVISVYTGIAQGIQPILSSSYGKGDRTAVHSILRYALITMLAISVLVYLGIFFGAEQITAIFTAKNVLLQQTTKRTCHLLYRMCFCGIQYYSVGVFYLHGICPPGTCHLAFTRIFCHYPDGIFPVLPVWHDRCMARLSCN